MTPRPSTGPYLARAVSSMWKRPASSSHQTHGSRQASSRVPSARVSYQRGSASSTIPCLVHVVRSGELARPTRWYEALADGTREEAWRDPWVWWDDDAGRFHMLLTARAKYGPADGRGVIGYSSSPDLTSWQALS